MSRSPRALADQFPIIRVMHAREQGVIHARSEGFDVATGDVLARVDADTRVHPSWARMVRDFFFSHGNQFAAGSGLCSCHDLPWQQIFRRQQRRISDSVAASLAMGDASAAESMRLFGSNMAIARRAWETVRADRSRSTDVFEDLDLSLTLEAAGYRIGLIPHPDAQISGRRFLSPPAVYLRYCWRDQRTLRRRGHVGRAWRAVGTTVLVQMPFYCVMWIPFRAFDPRTQRMRPRRLLRRGEHRVLPSGD
ncbi:glycosyltransferase [Williamsia deligens]|uniref:glycosyltransferase n=1 Tax=Williamsia deligens TaxID=321325 RepID=UPI002646F094|nr:glycosyltransferase family 2 protein [Williamsia deligens]